LKELVELRALRLDKEMLQKTNQFYVSQLSQLEVAISEFKAIAQARNAEIGVLRERLNQQDLERSTRSVFEGRELETKIALLEEENLHMKSYSDIRVDNERLKLELAHIRQVKDTYEAKFRETKVQLLGLQSEQGGLEGNTEDFDLLRQKLDEVTADKASVEAELVEEQGKVKRLEQLLVGKQEAEGRLSEELSKARERIAKIEETKASVEAELEQEQGKVRRLEQQLKDKEKVESRLTEELSQVKERLKATEHITEDRLMTISPILPSKRVPLSPHTNFDDDFLAALSRAPDLKPTQPKLQALAGKSSQGSAVSSQASVRSTPQPAAYVPSFLRSKKPSFASIVKSGSIKDLKPMQVRLTLSDSEEDFDMSIPEEMHQQ
jgi:hypothetical protein